MNTNTISVVVVGLPSNARQPMLLPGENMFQWVIRNHPQKWHNFVDRLCHDFNFPHSERDRLMQGHFVPEDFPEDFRWSKQIEEFMNSHLPTLWRTLKSLVELRDNPIDIEFRIGFRIVEILLIRKENGNKERVETVARNFGVRIIKPKVLTPSPYGYLSYILADIRGDFIWVVPGGTKLFPSMTATGLNNILEVFSMCSNLAFFYDNLYTIILRTDALRDVLLNRGHIWPDEVSEQMALFSSCGYKVAIKRMPLVELEPVYGGEAGVIEELAKELRRIVQKKKDKPWWKFW